jgi:hypothetical protein
MIQTVLDEQILYSVLGVLQPDAEHANALRNDAIWTIGNAMARASHEQMLCIVETGIMPLFFEHLLLLQDTDTHIGALDGLHRCVHVRLPHPRSHARHAYCRSIALLKL